MTGKGHVAAGVACATIAYAAAASALGADAASQAVSALGVETRADAAAAAALYLLGLLLPDCDTPRSTVGRVLYVPVAHRTWTHSIWPLLALCAASLAWKGTLWVALGCANHILMDSLSASGVCLLYPIQRYRRRAGGAFVKPRHVLALYHTGTMTEGIVVGALVALAAVSLAFLKGLI